jgi:protein-S-isoprenylcysteine O-methyltransferase Ste14
MESDDTFRFALVAAMTPTLAITAYHRLRAMSGERISHREEGYLFATALRLVAAVMLFSVIAFLAAPSFCRWATLPLPAWLRWMGVGLGVLSAPLMYWTLSSLGKNLTDTVVTRAHAQLVTRGPYRFVRHPFYVTVAILMTAATLISANWLIGVSGLTVLGLLVVRTKKEEAMLVARFGQAYRDYMQRTGRFIPRLG